jgi:hypothetical protein
MVSRNIAKGVTVDNDRSLNSSSCFAVASMICRDTELADTPNASAVKLLSGIKYCVNMRLLRALFLQTAFFVSILAIGVFINAFDATFSRTRSSQFQEGQSQ